MAVARLKVKAMRALWEAMMARITSEKYRKLFDSNPDEAAAEFKLDDPDWLQKLEECDRDSIDNLGHSWDMILDEDEKIEGEYKDKEWQAWADQLAQEDSSK